MAKGNVAINSEVVTNVLSDLSKVYSSFSGDIVSSVSGDFQVLSALGFTNCLSKIKSQSQALATIQKSIIDSIAAHLSEVVDTEEKLNSSFNDSYSQGYYVGDATESFEKSSGLGYDIDDDNDGKTINAEQLSNVIATLSTDDKRTLLSLIKTYKDNNTSLSELLTNFENSEELYKILKSVLKSNVDFADLSIEDTQLIQKTLLNTIVNDETEYIELNTDSVLLAKEYLRNICNDYKIEAIDLFNDDLYKNVLKTSIKNLYNGNVEDVSESKILEFRAFVDKIASNNNMSAIELINNNVKLLF